jgi:hypothetical protein
MRLVNISGPPLAPGVRVKNRLGLRKMLLDPFHCQKKTASSKYTELALGHKIAFPRKDAGISAGKVFLIQQNFHSRSG